MAKKIKDSLSAKVFLWIAGILILCSLLIYGSVMIFLPRSYSFVTSTRVEREINQLAETLSQTKLEDSGKILEDFCAKNYASVMFSDGTKNYSYGITYEKESKDNEVQSMAWEVKFLDREESIFLNIVVPVSSGQELTMAFLKLLPFVLVIIIIIASLGAFFCSRVLVKPILEISRISKRMAKLDLTWDCRIDRSDEIGTLAVSLNTMSKKLSRTMKELETANLQLKKDIEHIADLDRQRQHFFTAASHELKTPITILKGQVESMILEIGRYKNPREILPQTLKEIENMEFLVKEILSISKLEMNGLAGKTESVDFSLLLYKTTENLSLFAQDKKIKIHAEITENVKIEGNLSLLEKALHNILNNAIRHSPEGAEVYLSLSKDRLIVKNTGVMIPSTDLSVLFTPFYRVEKSRNKSTGGSGLGLYLTKTILEQHRLPYHMENGADCVIFSIELDSPKN